MKSTFTFFVSFMLISLIQGQTNADFENFGLPVDSFLNGSDMSGGFYSGNIFLENDFDTMFNAWQGWAISSMRDTVTPGYMNDLSAIAGSGYNGSTTYAVTFANSPSILHLTNGAVGKAVKGFFITNNTYAYLSIRDGDGFAKKFGGVSGDDPDYFLLTIKKYKDGILSQDSIDFYLADFRFSDNSQDYIVKDWTYISLESLGDVDSLQFSMSSTDNGMFGMNTPAYFCIDNFVTRNVATALEKGFERKNLAVYPNPTESIFYINWEEPLAGKMIITDVLGKQIRTTQLTSGRNQINISSLTDGIYTLSVQGEKAGYYSRIIKK
ncbi:MAG: DUF4465 domain-containing protein [Bacteroidetes bacterium]|nr:DUF4465 domain-containing protein [Bacteroidota bacterium]